MKILTAFLVSLLLVFSLPAKSEASVQTDAIAIINSVRATGTFCGEVWYGPRKPLKHSTKLDRSAYKHSRSMASNNYFSHSRLMKLIRSTGYRPNYAGENIAAGQQDLTAAVYAWFKSPGHCRILMSSKAKHIGMSGYYCDNSRWKRYWTLHVARPKS